MTEKIARKRMMKHTLHRYYIRKKRNVAKGKAVLVRRQDAGTHRVSRAAKSGSFITSVRRPIPRPPRPHRRVL